MLIGYARVSTLDQNLALQRDALKAAGCRRIFADEGVSGSVTARRGLEAALTALSPGDTLVVWRLDRLGRSLSHLVTLIAELGARRVNFRSLSDPIETASSGGRLVMAHYGRSGRVRAQLDSREDSGRNPGSEEARRSPRSAAVSGRCAGCSRSGAGRAWGISPCDCTHHARWEVHALSCTEGR
jgi:hypothetical protein